MGGKGRLVLAAQDSSNLGGQTTENHAAILALGSVNEQPLALDFTGLGVVRGLHVKLLQLILA